MQSLNDLNMFPTTYDLVVERINAINPIKYAKTRNFINGVNKVAIMISYIEDKKNIFSGDLNLPKIFNQKYDDFEVIVVNDRSWDNTKEILINFKDQFTNLNTFPENARIAPHYH